MIIKDVLSIAILILFLSVAIVQLKASLYQLKDSKAVDENILNRIELEDSDGE